MFALGVVLILVLGIYVLSLGWRNEGEYTMGAGAGIILFGPMLLSLL